MSRLFLTLLTMVLATGAMAQEIQNYVDVEGRSEIKITPNKFTLNIVIDESATKGVHSVAESERKMRTALKKIGVNVEEGLTVLKMTTTDIKREGSNSSAVYRLDVEGNDMVRKAFEALQKEGITRVNIHSSTHSKIEEKKIEAVKEALVDGREQAQLIAEALNQPLGDVYRVERAYTNLSSNDGNVVMVGYGMSRNRETTGAMADESLPELEFKQITIKSTVSMRFVLGIGERSKTMIIK